MSLVPSVAELLLGWMSTASCLMWKPLSATLVMCCTPVGAVVVPCPVSNLSRIQILGTRKRGGPRGAWPGCVGAGVSVCGLAGIAPTDRYMESQCST